MATGCPFDGVLTLRKENPVKPWQIGLGSRVSPDCWSVSPNESYCPYSCSSMDSSPLPHHANGQLMNAVYIVNNVTQAVSLRTGGSGPRYNPSASHNGTGRRIPPGCNRSHRTRSPGSSAVPCAGAMSWFCHSAVTLVSRSAARLPLSIVCQQAIGSLPKTLEREIRMQLKLNRSRTPGALTGLAVVLLALSATAPLAHAHDKGKGQGKATSK